MNARLKMVQVRPKTKFIDVQLITGKECSEKINIWENGKERRKQTQIEPMFVLSFEKKTPLIKPLPTLPAILGA